MEGRQFARGPIPKGNPFQKDESLACPVERGVIPPCPFCGTSAEVTTTTFGDSMTEYYRVECKEGDALDCWDDTKEEAIATWSRRAV